MNEGIMFEPERQKGNLPSRYGRGPSEIVGSEGALHKQLTRRNMTPNELAAWKLNQAMEKYPEFTKDARENAQNEFVSMPSLRTMNMKTLAATLSFLNGIKNNVTPNSFKDETILPYMKELINLDKVDQEETKRLIIRYKAQMLMYIRAIQLFRENQ